MNFSYREILRKAEECADKGFDVMLETKEIAKKLNLDKKGYKIVINTGVEGGQEVMHLHFHFLGGKNNK